jgi:hypothetical protein
MEVSLKNNLLIFFPSTGLGHTHMVCQEVGHVLFSFRNKMMGANKMVIT